MLIKQWFSNFLKISTLRFPEIFSITRGPYLNFRAKSSKEQEKKVVITSADVQSSTIQWDNLSEIRDLFAVPLKLLCGPQGDRGPQF